MFATMNPAAIGGGRSRLPRAISNLFASVYLEESTLEEIRVILEYMFAEELQNKVLSPAQLRALFELHITIKGMVKNSDIGRIGGPYEINLRDLARVRDVLAGNSKDQKYHYLVRQDSKKSSSVEDVNVLSLRKFTELVYASPFHSFEDQAAVREQINKYFPLTTALDTKNATDSDITMVEGSVRIGSIYITQGEAYSEAAPLEHTRDTVMQLEMLAAAAQSKRAVLLEGDTCSRKTSLVQELARITRHELVIIPMNEDTETADIIGQWLPMTAQDGKSSFRVQIREVVKGIMRTIVMHCSNLASKDGAMGGALTDVSRAFQHFDLPAAADKNALAMDREVLLRLKEALDAMCKELRGSQLIRHLLTGHQRTVSELEKRIGDVLDREEDHGIAFSFIKSQFIKAIENGWWVLLDGVNSAPSEVVERLNSLLEERPMLSLYEHADGDVLTYDNGIHQDFRFFATANIYRKNSSKLSSAFLNRMVRIWLPRMDSELSSTTASGLPNVASTDLMQLVRMKFGGISGGHELALVLLRFHQALQNTKATQDKLQFVTGFTLSFRCLQQTMRTVLYLKQYDGSPVASLVWSIQRNYISAAASSASSQRMCAMLAAELKKPDVMLTEDAAYRALPPSPQTMAAKHEVEARDLIALMCTFEEKIFHLVDTVILDLCHEMPSVREEAIGFIVIAFENMYQPRNPQDNTLTSTLIKAREKAAAPQNAGRWLVDNVQPVIKGGSPGSRDRLLIVPALSQSAAKVGEALYTYLERASFDDIDKRASRIRHIRVILAKFTAVLKFQGHLATNGDVQAKIQKLLKGGETSVSMLNAIVAASVSWADSMQEKLLDPIKNLFFTSLEDRQDRAAKHAFQMQLTRSILGPPASWPTLSSVVQSLVDLCGCRYEDLMPYCTMLQWKGLQWEFKLHPTCRILAVSPPGIDFLSAENIKHIEEVFCNMVIKDLCRSLLRTIALSLNNFVQVWSSQQVEVDDMRKRQQKEQKKEREDKRQIQDAKERCVQRDLELKDMRDEERKLTRKLQQLQEDGYDAKPDESKATNPRKDTLKEKFEADLKKVSEQCEKLDEEFMLMKSKIVQDEQEWEAKSAEMRRRHEDELNTAQEKQRQALEVLHAAYKQAYEKMEELRRHKCFKSLANMQASPGVSEARAFYKQVQAHCARIVASGRQATPDSIEQEFGKLVQSWPLCLTSPVGKLLIGTFLVPNARDPKCMLLQQHMCIVSTDDIPEWNPEAFPESRFIIYLVCGTLENDDAMSLCIVDALGPAQGATGSLGVHHWHSHGHGAARHKQWASAFIQSLSCTGLSIKESTHNLAVNSAALAGSDSLVDQCVLALHSLRVEPMGASDDVRVDLSQEEQECIIRVYEMAKTRMKNNVSINIDDSDMLACVKLVESDLLGKIGRLFKVPSLQDVWDSSKDVVISAQKFLESMMYEVSYPFGMFSGHSYDDSKREFQSQLSQLTVESHIDRYRALQKLRVLAGSRKLTVVAEIEKRLKQNSDADNDSAEFEHCDKALQYVRKMILIFVNVLQKHVQQGTFQSESCRRLVEAGQSSLSLCKELSYHVLSCIDSSSGSLRIRQQADEKLLQKQGEMACALLRELGFPEASIQQTGISGVFAGIAAELQRRKSGSPGAQDDKAVDQPQATKSAAQTYADDIIGKLETMMIELRAIKPTRYTILNDIRTFIRELKSAVASNASISEVERLAVKKYNPIKQKIAEIKMLAEAKDSAWLREFEIEDLKEIFLDRSAETLGTKATPALVQIAARTYSVLKGMTAESHAEENVETAKLHVATCGNMRCWQHLFDVCKTLIASHDEVMTERLHLFSAIVSEEVWNSIENCRVQITKAGKEMIGTYIVEQTFPDMIKAYISFRETVYDKRTKIDATLAGRIEAAREEMQEKFFDFSLVKKICSPASEELTAQTWFGMLVPTMKSILLRSNAVRNEERSYPYDMPFHLEPLSIRLADTLILFFADDLDSIYRLTYAQDRLDQALVQPNGTVRSDSFNQAKNARQGAGVVSVLKKLDTTAAPDLSFEIRAMGSDGQGLAAIQLFDAVGLQRIFHETRDLSFKLFDVLQEFLSDGSQERQAVATLYDSSDQIPQWQLALSLTLLYAGDMILHLLYSDERRSHRHAIAARIELAENTHNDAVLDAAAEVRACKERVTELEAKIKGYEEALFSAEADCRRDPSNAEYAHHARYIRDNHAQAQRLLQAQNEALARAKDKEKAAKERQRDLARERKQALLGSICDRLQGMGDEFGTFFSKITNMLLSEQTDPNQPTQGGDAGYYNLRMGARHDPEKIARVLRQLLYGSPLSTGDTKKLQDQALELLGTFQRGVRAIDADISLLACNQLKVTVQRVCHVCLCASYALSNSISNLAKVWRFEARHGKVVGSLVSHLRTLRASLEPACKKLSDAVENQENADTIADLASALFDKTQAEIAVAVDRLARVSKQELQAIRQAVESLHNTVTRFVFVSCSYALLHTPMHSRLMSVKDKVKPQYATTPSRQTIKDDTVVQEFNHVRSSLSSVIDISSRLFVPAMHEFVNNAYAIVQEDMDTFVEKNLRLQLSAKDVMVPCNLTIRAVKQLEHIFRWECLHACIARVQSCMHACIMYASHDRVCFVYRRVPACLQCACELNAQREQSLMYVA